MSSQRKKDRCISKGGASVESIVFLSTSGIIIQTDVRAVGHHVDRLIPQHKRA